MARLNLEGANTPLKVDGAGKTETQPITGDLYYTKIISNGKTQAQLDAAAAQEAAVIGAKTATTVGSSTNLTPQQVAVKQQKADAAAQQKGVIEGNKVAQESRDIAKQKQEAAAAARLKVIEAQKAIDAAVTAQANLVAKQNLAKAEADAKAAAAAAAAAAATAAANQANTQAALDAITAQGFQNQKNFELFMSQQVAASEKLLAQQTAASKLAYDTAATERAEALKVERTSAFGFLKAEFEKYGLGSLAEDVKTLMLTGTPAAEATLKLRATPAYQLRFAGNQIRLKEGRNLYDESTYLALENDFQESFAAYGQTNLLGATRESAQAIFSEYIGMDKSPKEIKDRIKLAVNEVKGRPDILKTFNTYFPSLDEKDLVSYFLSPKDTLSRLETKVQTAQIGTAASRQGLVSDSGTSLDLAQLGVTEQAANVGYEKIATYLPTMQKLGNIDNQILNQTTGENAYLRGLASEQRKIDKAAERERNRFAQSSGMNKVSLTDSKPAGQY